MTATNSNNSGSDFANFKPKSGSRDEPEVVKKQKRKIMNPCKSLLVQAILFWCLICLPGNLVTIVLLNSKDQLRSGAENNDLAENQVKHIAAYLLSSK